MKISVVIPVYNEFATLEEILQRVRAVELDKEIILVDDGSSDGSRDLVHRLASDGHVKAVFHGENRGKGAALRAGCLLYTSPSPRDLSTSRMPSSA